MEIPKEILFKVDVIDQLYEILKISTPKQLRCYLLSQKEIDDNELLENALYNLLVPINDDMTEKYSAQPDLKNENLLEFFQMWELEEHFKFIEMESNLPINVILHGKIPQGLRKSEQEAFTDFYIFYENVFVDKDKEKFLIGYNNTVMPQKKHGEEEYGRFYNTFHALMDIEFSKDFEKIFSCQGCGGVNYKAALFYIIKDDRRPFCSCIMCEKCCQEFTLEQECPCCYRVNFDKILNYVPITSHSSLVFEKVEDIEKKIEEDPQFVAEYIKEKMRNEAYEIDGKQINDVFLAQNVREEALTSLGDFIECLMLYCEMVEFFDDLTLNWNSYEEKTEILGKKLFEFKNEICLKYYELLCNNGLVSSEEMSLISDFVLPENDRENEEKYKSVEKNSEMWNSSLINQVYQKLKKMQIEKTNYSLSYYGVDNLYEKHILINK